ncbi:hypothetical protein HID58_031985 [Brassica napus]|uniref:Uncharacterized protein n=1 Tax=Brassica napus TaxID=3708 RepID=A0ABQ8BV25_BRANA|nr:hypothetical protein HID58_031985 [Brassica napus]
MDTAHRSKTQSLEDGIDEQKECRNSLKTDGSGGWYGDGSDASCVPAVSDLKVDPTSSAIATSRRPKGPRVISTPLVSPELQRNQRQLRYLTIRIRPAPCAG